MIRLSTFGISHFSEKARWALDRSGLAYEERRLVPGPHVLTVKRIAPKTTVPVLEHAPDGSTLAKATAIQGSGAILDYVARELARPELASNDAIARLETLADAAFGRGIQRIFYATLVDHRDLVIDMWSQDGPWWSRPLYRAVWSRMRNALLKTYRITPESVVSAKDDFRRAFDETDLALEKSGSGYLFGDAFSRADLAIAALLAPMVRPTEHPFRWPSEVPEPLAAFAAEFEGRPTWELVRRAYRTHRRPS